MYVYKWLPPLVILSILTGSQGCSSLRDYFSGETGDAQPVEPLAAAIDEAGLSSDTQTETQTGISTDGIDQDTLRELLAELKDLGENDPEGYQELIALVDGSDPALVSGILKVWKETLKHQQRDSQTSTQTGQHSADDIFPDNSYPSQSSLANGQPSNNTSQPVQQAGFDEGPMTATDFENEIVDFEFEDPQTNTPEPNRNVPQDTATAITTESSDAENPSSQSRGWGQQLIQLIRETEIELTQATEKDRLEMQVYLRMLYLMAGMEEKALIPIEGITPAESEFWKNTLWGLSNYLDKESIPDLHDRAAETTRQFLNAVHRLSKTASLKVTNLAFCQRIHSFGNFERFPGHPDYEFKAGQPVLLYAEVNNFYSERSNKQFRTVLQSTISLLDDQGNQIWEQQFEPTEDFCQSRRRDYFHTYNFKIPQTADTGNYVLKLTVTDQLSKKTAHATFQFHIN